MPLLVEKAAVLHYIFRDPNSQGVWMAVRRTVCAATTCAVDQQRNRSLAAIHAHCCLSLPRLSCPVHVGSNDLTAGPSPSFQKKQHIDCSRRQEVVAVSVLMAPRARVEVVAACAPVAAGLPALSSGQL